MIKHGMEIQQQITDPGQVPVTAFNQPLYALAKMVQWCWPHSHGEKKHFAMFGGLHIEMALWSTIGDFLHGSGWTTALSEAGIASTGSADSFLNACHLMRTRHGHEVTLLALSKLQFDAWQELSQEDESFEAWRQRMASMSPTFEFCDILCQFETLVGIFIRAQRTRNFNLYVEALEALVPWFFALDHINYARWMPVHIRDLKSLPDSIKEQFQIFWVVQKTSNKFSYIPIDQAHEQNNRLVKGTGGVVGLTENPSVFKRWMIAGPQQARLLTEFEDQFMELKNHRHQHHEQTPSLQESFKNQVNNLSEVIANMGNPFLEDCLELLVLDTRNCVSDAVIATVQNIEQLGIDQYQQYVTDVLKDRTVWGAVCVRIPQKWRDIKVTVGYAYFSRDLYIPLGIYIFLWGYLYSCGDIYIFLWDTYIPVGIYIFLWGYTYSCGDIHIPVGIYIYIYSCGDIYIYSIVLF